MKTVPEMTTLGTVEEGKVRETAMDGTRTSMAPTTVTGTVLIRGWANDAGC